MTFAKLLSLVLAALFLASATFAQDVESFQDECQTYVNEELGADNYDLRWIAQCGPSWTLYEDWVIFGGGVTFVGIWEGEDGEALTCGKTFVEFDYMEFKRQEADELVGEHWRLNTSIPTGEEDNEFWLVDFEADAKNFTSAIGTRHYAPADPRSESPSFVVYGVNAKRLCCNLIWTEVEGSAEDSSVSEDSSASDGGDGSSASSLSHFYHLF
ncbi:hypothetical protein QOT17_021510 [Balamuthia mandrillaris]